MHEFLAQHRREQSFSLDNDTPFSWIRCGVSICSYALLLSDVIRSGIAIHSMEQYKSIEPNSWLGFGPLNYSVAQVQLNDSIASPVKVWAYKFDTTSVTLRAVAQYFKLPSWDSCMFYQAQCKYTLLPSTVVFRMLEGLVEVVAARKSPYKEDPPNVRGASNRKHLQRSLTRIHPSTTIQPSQSPDCPSDILRYKTCKFE